MGEIVIEMNKHTEKKFTSEHATHIVRDIGLMSISKCLYTQNETTTVQI
jgi:hypothetical protein